MAEYFNADTLKNTLDLINTTIADTKDKVEELNDSLVDPKVLKDLQSKLRMFENFQTQIKNALDTDDLLEQIKLFEKVTDGGVLSDAYINKFASNVKDAFAEFGKSAEKVKAPLDEINDSIDDISKKAKNIPDVLEVKNGGSADWSLGEELLKAAGIDIEDTRRVVEENTKATEENTEAKKRNVKATEENTEAKKENVKATTEESTTTEEVITKKQKNVKQIQEETSNIVNQTKAWKDNYAVLKNVRDQVSESFAKINPKDPKKTPFDVSIDSSALESLKSASNYLKAFYDTQEVAMGKFANSFGTTISQSQKLSTEFDKLKRQLLEVSNSGDKKQFLIDFDKFQKDVKASAKETETLAKQKKTLIGQLENWEIKNREIIDSNEEVGAKVKELREDIDKVGDTDGIDKAKTKFTELGVTLQEAKKHADSFKTSSLGISSSVAQAAAAIESKLVDGLYNLAVKGLKTAVQEVQNLDAALVEIRKVTDFTGAELNAFVNQIKEVGNATATMTSDLLEASAAFARSGYTKEQIVQLTEEAAVLRNVSDGITDMGEASQVLISIMKAYQIPASQARTITDQLNNISNNAAISFDDLAEGIQRTGAVFANAGTSIGQLSALLTGANEVNVLPLYMVTCNN